MRARAVYFTYTYVIFKNLYNIYLSTHTNHNKYSQSIITTSILIFDEIESIY